MTTNFPPSIFVGVDPGKHGAIAIVGPTGGLLHVEDMPTADGKVSGVLLQSWAADYLAGHTVAVAVEAVHAMPKQGVSSSFNFGRSTGIVIGVFSAWPLVEVRPTEWKKAHRLTGKDKDAARDLALNTWPAHADKFRRKKDVDRADAALIATWLSQKDEHR